MCGIIAGFTQGLDIAESVRKGMENMARRGPDGDGVWSQNGNTLGHCRLAVIDTGLRASQPMVSESGQYVIIFNGEIYNFRELKHDLLAKGIGFRTDSDTEVLLALYENMGAEMLPLLRGMFAFIIWDTQSQAGFAARDPYGIKPLYYAKTDSGLWFASQVKSLLATGEVPADQDLESRSLFWQLGSVPEPNTWYSAIKALPAGHYAIFSDIRKPLVTVPYWDISDDFRAYSRANFNDDEIEVAVRSALQETVRAHLVSDVPVGIFLSGGIDSGALAGLMASAGAKDIHGITVAFNEFEGKHENEVPAASTIAERYGIKHHVRVVTKSEFLDDFPKILAAMDQPSIDGINTWFASKAVAELGLKVVISGVGGDELFQGYSSFSRIPRLVRNMKYLKFIPGSDLLVKMISRIQARRSGNSRWLNLSDYGKSHTGAWLLARGLYSSSEIQGLMPKNGRTRLDILKWIDERVGPTASDSRLAVSQLESVLYMRNQLLRDSDWASMAHSVELRTPLVDAHLLRSLRPYLSYFREYPGKSLLAQSVIPKLPEEITRRGKTGFGVPMHEWLDEAYSANNKAAQSRELARIVVKSFDAF